MRGYRKKVLSFFTAFMMLLSMGILTPFTVKAEEVVITPTAWNYLTLNGDRILDLSNFNDTDEGSKTITV